jgi:hypothetical protein
MTLGLAVGHRVALSRLAEPGAHCRGGMPVDHKCEEQRSRRARCSTGMAGSSPRAPTDSPRGTLLRAAGGEAQLGNCDQRIEAA